ncbi:hypothetical protein A3C60_01570 [Candidatus Nomurabacteria bacterium RIFCSPHIGHO2_02_FULL_37_45]|uniref:riboflavin kinase n=2 Tax=Candidatus Nomuraibacteriota TaxID=1752729 RepID=A0A1F6Y304_9BACT|nr:MAG: hypothetical protein A2727_01320 [Candidatus Nomurabacteria bacterium RIFCSPHIGHO2_01_FULL_37_110]OGI71321.1 MAG: hypothetical protein A3C60_01570 [Candidatus Nomurabacteria bacterium RIFCSPHIGHO2_02_FULL_37_45]OGI79549.1 MAG: hypothetical protein A3F19_02705 [Candidatus Nomurabacteria bacterium RIFCSPHIGHO2_12_FULL_37_29]OGI85432.1 MAG: hypothetical protein A3A92_02025 [Candidatus Nomurabacteria bacterium RIFCSPLOWO2_01_FULL_37_49]OGJ00726.1 MAG: hypothetical protein A3G98_02355 [Candi
MDYTIKGKVIRGDGYGRKLGFPTVNLETNAKELPKEGVYSGMATFDGKEYCAGIVIGPKENDQHKIEAHLIGYSDDAYEKEVILKINKFLREYKKFETEEELIVQIKKDIDICSQV